MTNDNEYPCLTRLDADCFRAQPAWAKQALAYRLLKCLAPGQITRRLPKGLRLALLTPGILLPPGIDIPPLVDTPPVLPPGVPGTGPDAPLYGGTWTPGPPGGKGAITPPAEEIEVTLYGSTADGYLRSQELTWALARNNPTNPLVDWWSTRNTLAMQGRFQIGNYWVQRSFMYFDLSSIPSGETIVSAIVGVAGYSNALSQVSIQEGTQGASLTTADFNAYAGSAFSHLTWQKDVPPNVNMNFFDLNAAGKTFVESKFGSTAKFCLREYTKDYLNVAPTDASAGNGMYYQDYAYGSRRPRITITYK